MPTSSLDSEISAITRALAGVNISNEPTTNPSRDRRPRGAPKRQQSAPERLQSAQEPGKPHEIPLPQPRNKQHAPRGKPKANLNPGQNGDEGNRLAAQGAEAEGVAAEVGKGGKKKTKRGKGKGKGKGMGNLVAAAEGAAAEAGAVEENKGKRGKNKKKGARGEECR